MESPSFMILSNILNTACSSYPSRVAIVSHEKRMTYKELNRMIDQVANFLIKKEVQKGDRVVVYLRNTYAAIIIYYAIVRIGAIEVALNVTTDSPRSILYKINDCKPKVLVTCSLFAKNIPDSLFAESSLKHFICVGDTRFFDESDIDCFDFDQILESEVGGINALVNEEDIATIAYTSGTTGDPKGVMLSHKNMISAAKAMEEYADHIKEDKTLTLIPIYHAYGKSIVTSRLLKGSTIFLLENTFFLTDILNLIKREQITGLVGVPTIIKMILDAIKNKEGEIYPSIKYISTGGSKMSEDMLIDIFKVFPDVFILSGYGLTEVGGKVLRKIFNQLPENLGKLNSCGEVIAEHEVALVNEEGMKVGAREVGEIIVRGPSIMKGYWDNPQKTNNVLKKGWLYTGDLGILDEEGDLYIVDRKKDIVKSGGELISPREIEDAINGLEGVEESAVIGIPDSLMGEILKAFVVLQPDNFINAEEIQKHCAYTLPPVKVPKIIEFRESLPKVGLNKVSKEKLRN